MKETKRGEMKGKAPAKATATPVRPREQFKPQSEPTTGRRRRLRAKEAAQFEEQAQEPFITTSPMALLQHELDRAQNEPLVPDVPISPLINVWASRPVAQLPVIEMVRWRFFELVEAKTRHVVGFSITTHSGRRSTAVISIDPKTMRAVTASGREYQLIGPPGYDDDAQYILEMSALRGAQWADVTKEVCAELGIASTLN